MFLLPYLCTYSGKYENMNKVIRKHEHILKSLCRLIFIKVSPTTVLNKPRGGITLVRVTWFIGWQRNDFRQKRGGSSVAHVILALLVDSDFR